MPSRFGKSTALSMLKNFFEITVDSSGERVPKTETPNHDLFTKKPLHLKQPLKISQDKDFMDKHFGEYPVIHLDFKDIKLTPFSEKILAGELQQAFCSAFCADHRYLLNSRKCPYSDELEMYFDKTKPILTIGDLQDKVEMYLKCLSSHFGKTVMIFIDEFDAPANKIIMHNQDVNLDEFSESFGTFVGFLLKHNPLVFCGFLTGITRYGEVYSWSAPNIDYRSVFLDKEYAPYIGLNRTEVKQLCTRYNQDSLYPQLEKWFDGYCAKDCNWKIFNTLSITQSLNEKEIVSTWINSGFMDKFVKIFNFENLGQDVWFALKEKSLKVTLSEKFTVTKLKILKEAIHSDSFDSADKSILLQFFLENGLFSFTGFSPSRSNLHEVASIGIPNKEIKQVLSQRLWVAARRKYGSLTTALSVFYRSLLQVKYDQKEFQEFIDSVASLLQIFSGSPHAEIELQSSLYRSTLFFFEDLDLNLHLGYFDPEKKGSPEGKLKIQKQGEPGRADYVYLRKNPHTAGNTTYEIVVIEFKSGSRHTVQEALDQCFDQDHARVCKNKKRLGDIVVTRCYYVGLYLDADSKVEGLMAKADEESGKNIFAASNLAKKKEKRKS